IFFFFQAEDGIRDLIVTGVQTCALPISLDSGWIHQSWAIGHTSGFDKTNLGLKYEAYRDNKHEALVSMSLAWGIAHSGSIGVGEIGRASCRKECRCRGWWEH